MKKFFNVDQACVAEDGTQYPAGFFPQCSPKQLILIKFLMCHKLKMRISGLLLEKLTARSIQFQSLLRF